MRKRVLFICGSINQTKQMHQVAMQMPAIEPAFTPYYCDGILEQFRKVGLLETTILGNKLRERCLSYLRFYDLPLDFQGTCGPYDLVVTCSDLIIPRNLLRTPRVLVQEGMTDPENLLFHAVRRLRFLRRLLPAQNRSAARNIAVVCLELLAHPPHRTSARTGRHPAETGRRVPSEFPPVELPAVSHNGH